MARPTASVTPARPLWAAVAWGCVLGASAACHAEIGRMLGRHNRHTAAPGMVYRSAQLDARTLRADLDRHGIRTLINLRGSSHLDWYAAEAACTGAAGVSQEDVTLSATRLPSPPEIRRLIEVFDRTEYPILLHCQQGVDRTGLAVAVWQLLYTDADYATARRQCSPRYGHFRALETARVDEFFDQYEDWLAGRGARHGPAAFRAWVTEHYKPGPAAATLELAGGPATWPATAPVVFRVRATNLSDGPWAMRAGTAAGVHARYWVWGGHGDAIYYGQAGRVNAVVAPGETVEIPLPVPRMPRPGRYRLVVDLGLGDHAFSQFGVDQLTHEWDAVSGD